MCLGREKEKSSGQNTAAPQARRDPVTASGPDLLRDPLAAFKRINGVHTSARGDKSAVNKGKVQVNGPGTARPHVAAPLVTPTSPPPPPPFGGAPISAPPAGGFFAPPSGGASSDGSGGMGMSEMLVMSGAGGASDRWWRKYIQATQH